MVIAIVALLVIGPEKLPKVARTLGALVGRMQRYAAQVKEEVNREARFEDLQKIQAEIKQGWEQAEQDYKTQAAELEQQVMTQQVEKPKIQKAKVTKSLKKAPAKSASVKGPVAKKVPIKTEAGKKAVIKNSPTKKPIAKKAAVKVSA